MDDAEIALYVRAKAELRKRMRALRNTTPASACAKRSEAIVARLRAMDAIQSAASVALFWPIEERHEVDVRPLDAELRARGVEIAYPSIDPETRVMTFRVCAPADLAQDPLGFRAAPARARAITPDVVVVPALALDELGRRLGYGAGFYDRALTDSTSIKVGVAYDFQLLVEVPALEDDVSMNFVVTDTRLSSVG